MISDYARPEVIAPILKIRRSLTALAGSIAVVGAFATPATAGVADWSAYLFGPAHGSYNAAATDITTSNAGTLGPAWTWTPSPSMNPDGTATYVDASPTVVDGTVFIGASNGDEYAIDESTGNVIWSRFLGFDPAKTCPSRGITSTAAVAPDPVSGNPTVYVGGGDGYLYALDAATGNVVWKSLVHHTGTTQNTAYVWSSPTLVGGHVLIGLASSCDNPLIRGALRMYDQATGALQDTYWVMPKAEVGGGIWTSAASDGSAVWVGTGDTLDQAGDPPPPDLGDSTSIVRLRINGDRLVRKEAWAPPQDLASEHDFGSSPTLFDATINGTTAHLVGTCSNDGTYYVVRRFAVARGPVWTFKVGGYPDSTRIVECHSAAIWRPGPATLILAGRQTEIDGVKVPGSVRSIDPSTGAPVWETALQDGVAGSPTMNGNGVIALTTLSPNEPTHYLYLVDASDGSILSQLPLASSSFSQPVFADQYLLVQPIFGALTAYCAACGSTTG